MTNILPVITCRDGALSPDNFGALRLVGESGLFTGGPETNLLAIHGYNNTETQVLTSYTRFLGNIKTPFTAFSWPGGDHPIEFVAAVIRAGESGYRFRDLLTMRYMKYGKLDSVITHSLGARVALTALKDGYVQVDKLILMAPAVDDDALSNEFASVPGQCRTVDILYSKWDSVLNFAFPIGDVLGNHRALGFSGPSSKLPSNVTSHDCSAFIQEHSDYLKVPQSSDLVNTILSR